jgi:hypothetical protein
MGFNPRTTIPRQFFAASRRLNVSLDFTNGFQTSLRDAIHHVAFSRGLKPTATIARHSVTNRIFTGIGLGTAIPVMESAGNPAGTILP